MPFTQSSDASIRIHAVFVLCHLSMLLPSQQTDLLYLHSQDIASLLGAFEYASTAGDHKASLPNSTRIMTVSEMTEVLVNLQMAFTYVMNQVLPYVPNVMLKSQSRCVQPFADKMRGKKRFVYVRLEQAVLASDIVSSLSVRDLHFG